MAWLGMQTYGCTINFFSKSNDPVGVSLGDQCSPGSCRRFFHGPSELSKSRCIDFQISEGMDAQVSLKSQVLCFAHSISFWDLSSGWQLVSMSRWWRAGPCCGFIRAVLAFIRSNISQDPDLLTLLEVAQLRELGAFRYKAKAWQL